ncbi:hypothetical protein DL771_002128 [Monosporascus sp. 5C6A]|nr:hypothetical protein DL771_002128 [Monosporascus sp. 5C6A]
MAGYGMEDAPLGAGLPPGDIHAVSVCLPRWEDAEGWARKDDKTLKAMKTGYPRFFIQPLIQRLAEELSNVLEELLIEHSFLYVDTIKILSKFGMNDITIYGFGSASELDELEERLRSGMRIGALFTEFPTNPLLTCIDLHRVRRLADRYGFVVVCDDTVGTSVNVDILQLVDVVVTSLTKLFSGACNVMGGSTILNPQSRHYGKLQKILSDIFEDTYFPEDAKIMARNCADFPQRVKRINGNAQDVATLLHSRTDLVKHVYYPSIGPSKHYYDLVRRPDGGYGYLLSVEFVKPAAAVAFFDALRVAKGPSLGTNFTLACPYTLFAHYGEMDAVAAYGVVEHLVRISGGQEEDILERVQKALEAAEVALGQVLDAHSY